MDVVSVNMQPCMDALVAFNFCILEVTDTPVSDFETNVDLLRELRPFLRGSHYLNISKI